VPSEANVNAMLEIASHVVPQWLANSVRGREFLTAYATQFADVYEYNVSLFANTRVNAAEGPSSTSPSWIALHACDRNTSPQPGETTEQLAARLQSLGEGVTVTSLVKLLQTIVDDSGTVGAVGYYETKNDGAYLNTWSADTGTGGTVTVVDGQTIFTPDVDFNHDPLLPGDRARGSWAQSQITLAGFAAGGNNVTAIVDNTDDLGIVLQGVAGVDEYSASATWSLDRLTASGDSLDNKPDMYCDVGFRLGAATGVIVFVLPFGTPDDAVASAREKVRQSKAGGKIAVIERREIAP